MNISSEEFISELQLAIYMAVFPKDCLRVRGNSLLKSDRHARKERPYAILTKSAVVVAWVAILVACRYPRGLFGFVEGVFRWNNRVIGYALTLVTDTYPPFRLAE